MILDQYWISKVELWWIPKSWKPYTRSLRPRVSPSWRFLPMTFAKKDAPTRSSSLGRQNTSWRNQLLNKMNLIWCHQWVGLVFYFSTDLQAFFRSPICAIDTWIMVANSVSIFKQVPIRIICANPCQRSGKPWVFQFPQEGHWWGQNRMEFCKISGGPWWCTGQTLRCLVEPLLV